MHQELSDLRDATASILGADAYGMLRFESGAHRVQRVPATESLGRVHTSTAVVVVLPAVEEGHSGGAEIKIWGRGERRRPMRPLPIGLLQSGCIIV